MGFLLGSRLAPLAIADVCVVRYLVDRCGGGVEWLSGEAGRMDRRGMVGYIDRWVGGWMDGVYILAACKTLVMDVVWTLGSCCFADIVI